jgi:uncharacterized phiE125 gp8 family phage protein
MITYYWNRWYQSLIEYRYAQMHRFHVRSVLAPTAEPISMTDAYNHLQIDTEELSPPATAPISPFDDWLEFIGIPGARAWCEAYQGISIAQQTLELTTDRFPADDDFIELPYGPVREVESVKYLDDEGNEVDFPDPTASPPEIGWLLDVTTQPNRLYLDYEGEWPAEVRSVRNSVKIRYIVGYSLADESPLGEFPLPPQTKIGMLLLLGHLFNNRENTTTLKLDEIPIGVKSFLDWNRERSFFV